MSNSTALPQEETLVVTSKSAPHHLSQPQQRPATALTLDETAPPQPAETLEEVCADLHDRVSRFLAAPATDDVTRRAQEQTRVATSVIDQALRDYDFNSLSISYNGGKDCLVLLILYLSVLHTHFTQPLGRRKDEDRNEDSKENGPNTTTDFPTSIPSIYAKPPDPFDSVTTFVDSSSQAFHLDLTHISTNPGSKPKANSHSSPPLTSDYLIPTIATATATNNLNPTTNGDIPHPRPPSDLDTSLTETSDPKPTISFRDAFALYLHTNPNIRAIFVGTRRTDPHGASLSHFQMTDGNWPRFMRIHPVIDWRLSEIWCFLRSGYLADPRTGRTLEYCGMYDAGYTSLGGVGDTLRNPRLRYIDKDGLERYRPAYEMTEDDEERAGRE